MAGMTPVTLCIMTLTLSALRDPVTCENLQAWSQQSELGVNHVINCGATMEHEPQVSSDDTCTWRRLGESDDVTAGGRIALGQYEGGVNCEVTVTGVTEGDAGIYICHVTNTSSTEDRGKVTKGLNIAGPKYASSIDEYETNIITAFLTGAGVCVLVCACCFVEHYRYRSPEQKQKIEMRRKQQEARMTGQGVDNPAMDPMDSVMPSYTGENTQL